MTNLKTLTILSVLLAGTSNALQVN